MTEKKGSIKSVQLYQSNLIISIDLVTSKPHFSLFEVMMFPSISSFLLGLKFEIFQAPLKFVK